MGGSASVALEQQSDVLPASVQDARHFHLGGARLNRRQDGGVFSGLGASASGDCELQSPDLVGVNHGVHGDTFVGQFSRHSDGPIGLTASVGTAKIVGSKTNTGRRPACQLSASTRGDITPVRGAAVLTLAVARPERVAALTNPWPRCCACVPYHAVDAQVIVEIELWSPGPDGEPELTAEPVPLCRTHFWTQLPALQSQHQGIGMPIFTPLVSGLELPADLGSAA